MPKSLHERLIEKGWSQDEINHTMELLYSEDKKEKNIVFTKGTHPIIYWIGLLIAIIGNFLLAVTLIPFLMVLSSFQLYILLAFIGVAFGALFNSILKDIEQVDQSHHVMAGVFIPAIALITIYVMITVADKFNALIKNTNDHNAYILSAVYLVAFAGPYALYKIKDLTRHSKPVNAKAF
jgi:hypothetical protein